MMDPAEVAGCTGMWYAVKRAAEGSHTCADAMQGNTAQCHAESCSRLPHNESNSLDAHQVPVSQLLAVPCDEVHSSDARQGECMLDSKEPPYALL